jgi:ferrochelatase
LPIYWGNRNWHPLLADTLREMKQDGVRKALAFVTSAYSSYSGCRQYLENIAQARAEVGGRAPAIDKLRLFFNHPGFIEAAVERVRAALALLPADARNSAKVIYTAHSIPISAAQNSRYVQQLEETCRLVSERLGRSGDPLVFQSRSGPPTQPWLEPDILQYLREVKDSFDTTSVVIVPIGFISDHMEVLYDLDTEAQALCRELGIQMVRAATVGTDPKFVGMIRDLILERLDDKQEKQALGILGPSRDVCPGDCCLAPQPVRRGFSA